MKLSEINTTEKESLRTEFLKCCASEKWAAQLVAHRPFKNMADLFSKSKNIWFEKCGREDWLQAFSAHPKIGDIDSLAKKYSSTKNWSSDEQSGVDAASMETLKELADKNKIYEEKNGYIFIVCATGKSAKEMLDILTERLKNNPEDEIDIAMQEQHKITEIRLKKLMAAPNP